MMDASFALIVGFLLCISATHGANVPPKNQQKCLFDPESAFQAAKASNDFGWKVLSKIKKPEENLVFSPVSISLALALLESGTDGETSKEIRRQIGFNSLAEKDPSGQYESLFHIIQIRKGKDSNMNITDGIFHSENIKLKKSFTDHAEKCFNSHVSKVPFSTKPEEARKVVNDWVSDRTNNNIQELLEPGTITAGTVAALIDVLYLNALWESPFKASGDSPFYSFGRDQAKNVPFMSQESALPYKENDNMQIVELPYQGLTSLSFFLINPKQRDGLQALENFINSDFVYGLADMSLRKVNLKIPKFNIRSKFNLADTLGQLGIKKVFSDQADFSRMTDGHMRVNKAVHEAFVKVYEEGTEAGAASGFNLQTDSKDVPMEVTADRPFSFLIVHKITKAVVFLGRVVTL